MLDLYKLQIFSLVVQEGSFSGAANILLMSQSGVSQHIQELEKRLGTQLFIRERRGVSLTSAGETLLEYTDRLLKIVGEAENAVTDVRNLTDVKVSISATPGISIYLMPDWSRGFRNQYPNLSMLLETGVTSQVVANIHQRRSDMGLIEGELDATISTSMGIVALQKVEQYIIIGAEHRWWGRESIAMEELDGQSIIMRHANSQTRRWLEQMLHKYAIKPHIVAEFDNLESIKRSVISGTCLTILPSYTVQQERDLELIQIISIADSPLQRTLKLIWDKGNHFTPVTLAFLRYLETHFPDLQQAIATAQNT